jgi:hypothetical protein
MLVPQLLPTRPPAAPATHRKAPAGSHGAHHAAAAHHTTTAHHSSATHHAHATHHDGPAHHADAAHHDGIAHDGLADDSGAAHRSGAADAGAAHHSGSADRGTAVNHSGAAHRAGRAHHVGHRGASADDPPDSAAFDLELLARQQTFDLTVKQRSENEREMNVLRDLAMAQLKKDDENMKKWIALI